MPDNRGSARIFRADIEENDTTIQPCPKIYVSVPKFLANVTARLGSYNASRRCSGKCPMSKLLTNEEPLQVILTLAVFMGLNESIALQ